MDPDHRDHLLNALWVAVERGDASLDGLRSAARKPVADTDVDDMVDEGLVEPQAGQLELSPAGHAMAQALIRRYRLSEALLHIVYGRDAERASALACELEHDLRPEMTDALCTFLGHPTSCPHGHPIPPGPCCNLHLTTVASPVVPLSELKAGEKGRVVYLHPRNHERLHRLSSLGITPNVLLTVHQRLPAWVVRFEGTELAFDRDVATDIFVTRVNGD
jgi:DtxR family Mn-dependent transcriptional regulator